ncbi:hypothetical protein [Intestinibacter bartlettii]
MKGYTFIYKNAPLKIREEYKKSYKIRYS